VRAADGEDADEARGADVLEEGGGKCVDGVVGKGVAELAGGHSIVAESHEEMSTRVRRYK
jgi:hypothetical protein